MTELEKLAYAKTFIDKLANGINPIDGKPVAETDVVNNVRLSRCLFYVSDILRQVIDVGGVAPRKKSARVPFSITQEQLAEFSFSNSPIPITELTNRINALINTDAMKPFRYKHITAWLISIGALSEEQDSSGKYIKIPTEEGEKLGITAEIRNGIYGNYRVVVYNRDAQQFVIDNIDAIISSVGK